MEKVKMLHKKLSSGKGDLQIGVFLVFLSDRWNNTEGLEQEWKNYPETDLAAL